MATLDQGVLSRALSLQIPGKVNLSLRILGRRNDGFHELESVVAGVGLYDHLRVRVSDEHGIQVVCDDLRIDGEDNLARRAAEALRSRLAAGHGGLLIELNKRIPVGAGLGGGSADAAAALRLCDAVWDAGFTDSELAEVGASIGSDVAVFFHLPSAVMRGRGDRVERVSMRWRGWAMLITPPFSSSTRAVYQAWRAEDSAGDRADPAALLDCEGAEELSALGFNDLSAAAMRVNPTLGELKTELERHTGGGLQITGSGSTLFRLYDDYQRAVSTAERIKVVCPGLATAVVEAPVAPGGPEVEE